MRTATLLTGGGGDLPDIMEQQYKEALFLITCGHVGVPRLSAEARQDKLAIASMHKTVLTLSELNRAFDIEHGTTQDLARVERIFLADTRRPWVDRVRRKVDEGHRLVSPRATAQLIRETIEFASTEGEAPKIDKCDLVHMLLSVTSEQEERPEHEGDVPSTEWVRAYAAKVQELDADQTAELSGTIIPHIVASLLFNKPVNLDMILANTLDTWFRQWSTKTKRTDGLGATAAETFKITTGVELLEVIHLGTVIAKLALTRQQVQFHRDELTGLGVTESALGLLFCSMSLHVDEFRQRFASDRQCGPVGHQRYALTQFPFMSVDENQFIMLSYAWAIDKLCGSQLHFVAGESLTRTHPPVAKRFRPAMNDIFEDIVGEALGRIVRRSRKLKAIIAEGEMQDAWLVKKGEPPRVCDWTIFADGHCIAIEATTHSVNKDIAQGLSTWAEYSKDIETVFTETKFDQLAKTFDQLRERGGWNSEVVDGNTTFIPLVVVPDAGLPSVPLIEMDLMRRGHAVFGHLQSLVAPPTIMQLSNLQLLEGLAESCPNRIDILDVILGWRMSAPQSLQEFALSIRAGLPLSRHVRLGSRTLKENLNGHLNAAD